MFCKNLKRKLNSNEGASLMVALLFFVMCATIGSVILAAATASAGRLKNLEKEDQTYYVTSSAAEAVSELIAGKDDNPGNKIRFRVTYDRENKNAPDPNDPKDSVILITKEGEVPYTGGNNLFLADFLHAKIKSYLTGNIYGLDNVFLTSVNSPDVQITSESSYMDLIVKKGGLTVENLSARAVFSMNDNLDLIVSLRPLDEETDRNNITLTFTAVKKLDESVQEVVAEAEKKKVYQKNTYSIYWDKPYVSKGSIVVKASGGGE